MRSQLRFVAQSASFLIVAATMVSCTKTSFSGSNAAPALASPSQAGSNSSGSGINNSNPGGGGSSGTPGTSGSNVAVNTPASAPNGTTPSTGAPSSAPNSINSMPCTAAGITQATLLTPTVVNGAPGNYIEYKLSITDCNGNAQALTATNILFDVDATITGANITAPLSYTVTAQDNSMQGSMLNIQGSDLFGNTGSNFFHYSTDQSISFATAATSVILTINLGGRTMSPFPSSLITGPNQMATYLRFGQANPVAQVVTLITPGS